jgi:hypothetical protein
MLARLRLAVSILLLGTGFTLLGGLSPLGEKSPTVGMGMGCAIGILFGLGFGGFRAKWFECLLCGPEDKEHE